MAENLQLPDDSTELYHKDDILHFLAHELRQPVNAIIGFSELIGRDIEKLNGISDEKLIKHNRIVTQQGIFLKNIIDQIFSIALTNQLNLNKSQFLINSMLEELYEVFNLRREQINKTNISLRVTRSPEEYPLKIYTDEVKLKQLFTNIIFNAFKYTNDGSISFGVHSYNSNVVTFFVSDTGVGIPVEKYDKVFNKYTRLSETSDSFKSVGLGLSLSQKLASVLGGRLWFESAEGQGTTFYFSIITYD